jgi:endonuclease/exonuclease/phosphatase family metal-dependent hydrolase
MRKKDRIVRGALVMLLFLSACGDGDGTPVPDADADVVIDLPVDEGDVEFEIPVNAVPFNVATWNLRQFPQSSSTITHVVASMQNLGLDLVAFQEIQEEADWNELLDSLPGYDAVLYTGPFDEWNSIGVVWRTSVLRLVDSRQILTSDTFAFPRAPVQAEFELLNGGTVVMDFILIALHLKAGMEESDEQSRTRAIVLLADHVAGLVEGPEDDEVLIVGDFNEAPTDPDAALVYAPLRSRSSLFRILTWDLPAPEEATYLPGGVVLDHMVSTAALDDEIGINRPVVPHLEDTIINYVTFVSDHRPVTLRIY